MEIVARGFIIGFCIAAPVGPIGLLCIRRSLVEGRATGFATGLGAASADGVYGLLAVSGLTAVTRFLTAYQPWIQALGAGFLIYLGLSIFRQGSPAEQRLSDTYLSRWKAYRSTFLLTLSNPATILSLIGIFAGLGMNRTAEGFGSSTLLVIGVVLGSATWWLFLSSAASWLGSKTKPSQLRWINFVAGGLIAGFGVFQLLQLSQSK